MFCPKCGERIIDGSRFCQCCGNEIETVKNLNGDVKKPVKLIICSLIIIGIGMLALYIFLTDPFSKPSKSDIEKDITAQVCNLVYENPFTGEETIESMEIDSIETVSEKRKKDDFDAKCIVHLSSMHYSITKYITCHYLKHGRNTWYLDQFSSYDEDNYEVLTCPFSEYDAIAYVEKRFGEGDYTAKLIQDYENAEAEFIISKEENSLYCDTKSTVTIEMMFEGDRWGMDESTNESTSWNIIGEWALEDETDNNAISYKIFAMDIKSFDNSMLAGTGNAYFLYGNNRWEVDGNYLVENAVVKEYNGGLLICFSGEPSDFLGLSNDVFVIIYPDDAYAYYGSNWRKELIHKKGSGNMEKADENSLIYQKDFIFPDSDSRYLVMSDLAGLTAEECKLARNEIYARHGRMFDDEFLQDYFNSKSWYQGMIKPEEFNEDVFNDYEIKNRDMIIQYEKERGYR